MFNGVSAILSNQKGMDVIGNNIANVSTTGFKAGAVSFADQLSETLQSATTATTGLGGKNAMQVGHGVRVGSIDIRTGEGGLSATSVPTDLAIQGNGYFMIANSSGAASYSRDGHFAVDGAGNLVSANTGERVLGWAADTSGVVDTTKTVDGSSALSVPVGSLTAASATKSTTYVGNLDSGSAAGATVKSDVTVYDSLGTKHNVTLNLTRDTDPVTGAAANTWSWTASGDSSLAAATGTTNTGKVTFDTNGQVSTVTGSIVMNPPGATSPQTIALNLGTLTQLSGASSLTNKSQDGFPLGTLQSFSIDGNGVINGVFSNGLSRKLGQIALATFSNPAGLQRVGNNEFALTTNSGDATVGTANSQGLGSIQAGYLEQSNVDLSVELTNMIVSQRAYQANTKIVTTVDQMLNELINMKQ
jgi:flagellar hook protein FlgE